MNYSYLYPINVKLCPPGGYADQRRVTGPAFCFWCYSDCVPFGDASIHPFINFLRNPCDGSGPEFDRSWEGPLGNFFVNRGAPVSGPVDDFRKANEFFSRFHTKLQSSYLNAPGRLWTRYGNKIGERIHSMI